MSPSTFAEPRVVCLLEGRLGRIVLNRPDKINALDPGMIATIAGALRRWREDRTVDAVLLQGAGDRGLCAGGDLAFMWRAIAAPDGGPEDLWIPEYALIALIAEYPKPIVALMDGVVLGGGVGLSAHAGIRVVTERSSIGMPETAIGLIPDVGVLHLLARAGGAGARMAVLGARVDGPTAITLGLADHFLPSERVSSFVENLRDGLMTRPAPVPATGAPQWVSNCWSAPTVEEIALRLGACLDPAARSDLNELARLSPTAIKVALQALHRARTLSLRQTLAQDLVVCSALASRPDLTEGIRAKIIDKDNRPRWHPATLDQVSPQDVASVFAVPDRWQAAVDELVAVAPGAPGA